MKLGGKRSVSGGFAKSNVLTFKISKIIFFYGSSNKQCHSLNCEKMELQSLAKIRLQRSLAANKYIV